jgi:hypothetical protein
MAANERNWDDIEGEYSIKHYNRDPKVENYDCYEDCKEREGDVRDCASPRIFSWALTAGLPCSMLHIGTYRDSLQGYFRRDTIRTVSLPVIEHRS